MMHGNELVGIVVEFVEPEESARAAKFIEMAKALKGVKNVSTNVESFFRTVTVELEDGANTERLTKELIRLSRKVKG